MESSRLFFAVLTLFCLVSCFPQAQPTQVNAPEQELSKTSTHSQTLVAPQPTAKPVFKPKPIFIPQSGPHGSIQSDEKIIKIGNTQHKSLTFTIDYSSLKGKKGDGFKTQALRCQDIDLLKVEITGINIGSPMYPAGVDGNNNIPAPAGCTIAATINNVPFGTARIAKVEAFETGPTAIPGSLIMTSFDVSADPTNVEISYKSTPVGDVMNRIIVDPAPFLAAYMDVNALRTLVDSITGVAGTFPDYTFTYHPHLVDNSQLAADLIANGGNSGALTAGDYDNTAFSSVTGTLAGLLGTDTASIQITDPASPISINNGNGGFSFTNNVVNGTSWVVHAEHPSYTADLTPTANVGAGASVDVGTITFTWANTPNISSLSTVAEIIGNNIQINGTDFHPEIAGNTVKFGTTTATVTAASPTQLTATVPAGIFGVQNVTVTVGTVVSNSSTFNIKPNITSLAPNAAGIGGTVLVHGTGFDTTIGNNTLTFFNGVNATITAATTIQLDTTVPAGTTTGNVTVTVAGQTSAGVAFTMNTPPTITVPAAASQNPVSGLGYPIQMTVTATDAEQTLVAGSYTWSCTANCGDSSFAPTTGTSVIWTANSSAPGGAVTLQVAVSDGIAAPVISSINVNVTSTQGQVNVTGHTGTIYPEITSLSTGSIYVGQNMQINGRNFDTTPANNQVRFGGIAATVNTANATQLDVTVPAGIRGANVPVLVTVAGKRSNANNMRVIGAPTINSFFPLSANTLSGLITGDIIELSGQDFDGATQVQFNGVTAPIFAVDRTNLLTVQVPGNITDGTISVTTPGGTVVSGSTFKPGKILFSTDRDGNFEIYKMNADGTQLQRMTNSGDDENYVDANATKDIIVFSRNLGGSNREIFKMNFDGTGETQVTVTDPADDKYPRLSPDGTKIVFHSDRGGNAEVWVINTDGTGLTQLTNTGIDASNPKRFPSWSPDGTKIVYVERPGGGGSSDDEIYIMDVNGGNPTRITNDSVRSSIPFWSPNNKIVIRRDSDEVATYNADGSGEVIVTSGNNDTHPDWGSNGNRIVFERGNDIFVMEANGANPTNVTGTGDNQNPVWTN